MQQRLHGLDFLRALMMLLGIVLHGAQIYMLMELGFDYYRDPVKSPTMDGILILLNTFRMPVFFVLSGFFTAMLFQRYGLPGMLKNRLQRIALPILVFLPPLSVILSLQWIAGTSLMKTGSWGLDTSLLDYPRLLWNNTHHLWFLYYLLIILAVISLAIYVSQYSPQKLRRALASSLGKLPASSAWTIVVTGFVFGLLANHNYVGRFNGNILWQPYWPSVFFFGLCLLIGWALFYQPKAIQAYALRGWLYLVLALCCFAIALAAFFNQGEKTSAYYSLIHPILSIGNGLSVAFFIAAFIGLFYRYCNRFNPWTRYFSDAAYWIFLLHQPVLLLFAMPLHDWQVAAELKFLVVTIGTLLVCTVTYHYWVRNTAIGALLNGRRYPRSLPAYPALTESCTDGAIKTEKSVLSR